MNPIVNRKAKFDYVFLETYTSGICLLGSEVKSIKEGKVNLIDSYCILDVSGMILKNMDIPTRSGSFQHEPKRDRRLLLRKKELKKIDSSLGRGLTIIPIKIFTNPKGKIKMEIAICRGKKNYDKREDIKRREAEREIKSS